MPRSLPWLVGGKKNDGVKPKQSTLRPGRVSPDSEVISIDTGRAQRKESPIRSTPKKANFLRSSITPPSSPIRQPPVEEFLKEGFDEDDMYIMVEDEFYAVAQTFTQCLHHAEYVRRRKQAKEENATVIKDLARPTDGRTMMRNEIKKRMESNQLRDRQKEGLNDIRGRRPRLHSEEEDENNDLDEELEDDPWVGTSLYTFMTGPRHARSLVGLQGIKSTTRAAAGYSRTTDLDRRNEQRWPPSERHRGQEVSGAADETASENDDDLEIAEVRVSKPTSLPRACPSVSRPPTIKRESPELPTIKHEFSNSRRSDISLLSEFPTTSTRSAYSTASGSTITIKSRKRILLDELDEFSDTNEKESKRSGIQGQPRSSVSARVPSSTSRAQEKGSKKSRFSEVPTFLM